MAPWKNGAVLSSYQRQSGGGHVPKERVCLEAFVPYVTLSLGVGCAREESHEKSEASCILGGLELNLVAVHGGTRVASSLMVLERAH